MQRNLSLSSLGLAVVAASLAFVPAASASVVVDGYTWDAAYTGDGNALPTASTPAWTTGGGGGASVSGGELTIDTTTNDGKYFEIASGGAWNPASGNTAYVQFRTKVNSQNGTLADHIIIGSNIGYYLALEFGTTAGNTGVFLKSGALVHALDVSQYHTYRVATDGGTYSLWVDDMNTPVVNNATLAVNTGNPSMYFGDGGGGVQGSSTWDYIAWNVNSAPVAVPEPVSASLLGIGGMMLLALRRK